MSWWLLARRQPRLSGVCADGSGCHGPEEGQAALDQKRASSPLPVQVRRGLSHLAFPLADLFSLRDRRDLCPQEVAAPPEAASVGIGRPGTRGEGRAPAPPPPQQPPLARALLGPSFHVLIRKMGQ